MSGFLLLTAGAASTRLLPQAGGRVSALRLARPSGGVMDVLFPYPEDFFDPVRWAKGGIYPLMPYSNRIANASLLVNGKPVALLPHPDAAPHSLHGNAHALAWRLVRADASSAVMVLDALPSPAWPWKYAGRIDIELTPMQLSMGIEIRNDDDRSMPAGIGLHPYFRHQQDALIGYHAATVWPTTPEFLAVAPRPPQADEISQPARALPAGGLTRYVGGWDGKALLDLPEGACLRIDADPVFSHLVVHRPDNLAYLCIEPVSHVADGFNLAARGVPDTGTRLLAPGEKLGGAVRFSLEERL
jgi:aldose 1-epimerase